MALLNWPTITDDSGTKQDGTVLGKSLFDDIKASIEDTLDAGFDGLVVGFTGTAVADEVQVGDTAFKLDFDGGGASVPALQFASGDRLQYDRASDAFLFMLGGVEGFRISSALARLPNAAALSWRNAGGSADVEVLSLDSSNRAILGKDATSVRLPNARVIAWLNAAGSADLDIFKVNSSNILEIGEDAVSISVLKATNFVELATFTVTPNFKLGSSAGFVGIASSRFYTDTTQKQNGTTVETDLHSTTLLGNTLDVDGKAVTFLTFGNLATANTKVVKFYLGSDSITLYNSNGTGVVWWEVTVIRTGAATQKVVARGGSMNGGVNIASFTRTLSIDNTAKFTCTGGATGDCIMEAMIASAEGC